VEEDYYRGYVLVDNVEEAGQKGQISKIVYGGIM
jgi:hypothetical protein